MLITAILALVTVVQADESESTHRPEAALRQAPLEFQHGFEGLVPENEQLVLSYRALRPSLLRVHLPLPTQASSERSTAKPEFQADRIVSGVVLREVKGGCLVVVPGVWTVGNGPLKVFNLDGQREFLGKPLASSSTYSLSLLQVDGLQVEAPPFGLCETLPVGALTLVLGNPYGLDGSLSVGILSGRGRNLGHARDLIQISNPLNPGDGGGIVADSNGRLIAIAMTSLDEAARIRPGGLAKEMARARGISFAIPLHHVLEAFEEQLSLPEDHQRPRLGVEVREAVIPREIRRKLGLPMATALRIAWVDEMQPAGLAGMQVGDYLLGLGGRPLASMSCLYAALRTATFESQAKVLRGGQTLDLRISFLAGEDSEGANPHAPRALPALVDPGDKKKKD